MRPWQNALAAGLILWLTAAQAQAQAQSQSAAEMLERGIYTEETVGDLPEAIKIYQEIVRQEKANRQHAAQAQFRLALCYSKMGQKEESAAALQTLIDNFADQKELVAKAKQLLPGGGTLRPGPAPWVDNEQLQLTAKLGTGLDIGAFTLLARTEQLDGREVWRTQVNRNIAINAPNMGISRVLADRETSAPIHSLFRHTILGTVEVNYSDGEAVVVTTGVDGNESSKTMTVDGVHYDNEQAMFLFRQLPLEVGYKVDVPIFAPLGEGPMSIGLEVLDKETVTVPAGEFECFKVYLALVQQTFWYSADEHRYLVKFEAGGVSVQLSSIRTNPPGELVQYDNNQFGFQVSAPTEWYLIDHTNEEDRGDRAKYAILDPEAKTLSALTVKRKSDLDTEQQESLRAWVDATIAKHQETLTGYTVRADSWEERTVGGQPALSYIADFSLGNRQMVEYSVRSLVDDKTVVFESRMESKWFDDVRQPFDAIIDTFQVD